MQNSYSAKGLFAEICSTAIMKLMPVNQKDTAFEYAVIFVCWIIYRFSQQHSGRNCYMIMLLNIGRACRGLTGGFLLLRNFSVTISVSPHVCFILV